MFSSSWLIDLWYARLVVNWYCAVAIIILSGVVQNWIALPGGIFYFNLYTCFEYICMVQCLTLISSNVSDLPALNFMRITTVSWTGWGGGGGDGKGLTYGCACISQLQMQITKILIKIFPCYFFFLALSFCCYSLQCDYEHGSKIFSHNWAFSPFSSHGACIDSI